MILNVIGDEQEIDVITGEACGVGAGAIEQGGAGGAACRRAGVSEQTLYCWREEFLNAGNQELAGRGADREQDKEVNRLHSALAERDPGHSASRPLLLHFKKLSDGLS